MKPSPTHTLFAAASGFESARQVTLLPEGHRSRRLHGHSFVASVRASLPAGWASFPGGEVARLRAELGQCTQALDYRLLNDTLAQPTDENIARWLREQLQARVPGIEQVGVQSTAHEGVDLDTAGQAHVWRRYQFQAAHRLPHVRPGHKCGRMHGHGFEVIVHANQALGRSDLSIDYDHLDDCWAPLHMQLNYGCLNDLPGLDNPTSEVMSSWLWTRLKPVLPALSWITVYETASCGANFDGTHYRIWKDFTLDSAVQLKHAPQGSALRRIHGYTYTLRLHLCAPLDALMGWTVDFGDVKELFNPIFKALDHQPLFAHPELTDGDAASMAQWILARAREVLPMVDRVDLYETRGCGAVLSTGEQGPALPL